MSVSTAIGLVSELLQKLLQDEMTTGATVTLLSPHKSTGNSSRVNLFLYRVQENSTLSNADWQVKPGQSTQLVPPPLSLNLFYLMTAYASDSGPSGDAEAQRHLGEAMRVFYENPIRTFYGKPTLELEEAREQVTIMLVSADTEELIRLWSTFSEPYRPSVTYEVSVVQLDMESSREKSVGRLRKIGSERLVDAQHQPPVVTTIDRTSGPAGTLITVQGQNLVGWRAYVSVMGKQILATSELTENSFTVTIPATLPDGPALPTGFHRLQVDISRLFRRTFLFEVTPSVDTMAPSRGPAGQQVQFSGRDLSAQEIDITFGGQPVPLLEQTENSFTIGVPGGFSDSQEIRISVGDIYSRTFAFTVTQ